MSIRFQRGARSLLPLAAMLLAASPSFAASWQNNVNYGGSGPTMDLYVPDNPDASPGIVVALHYCSGNSGNTHSWFQSLADQHGFMIISPDVGGPQNCWNATPARSGETAAIVQMVNFALNQEGGDATRVFAAGASSGACMTNALLAAYPDVFAGGSVLAGVPAGAWTGGNECSVCGQNPPNRTAQQWGDIVRNAFSFSGTRPRVQLWHGTSDTTLNYSNLAAELLQWTNVLGVGDADATMQANTPKSGWSRTSYTNSTGTVVLESNVGQGAPHDLTGQNFYPDIVRFFGLDMDTPPGTGGAGGGAGTGSGGAAAGAAGAVNGGAGGVVNTGGAGNAGGAGIGTGGVGNGGQLNGGAPNGGVPGTGGAPTAGAPSAGTTNGGAGMATGATGGMSVGGTTSTGGTTTGGTGGTGNVGTGGTGNVGTGGTTAGAPATDAEPEASCGCRVGPKPDAGRSLSALGVLGLGLVALKRRRRATR